MVQEKLQEMNDQLRAQSGSKFCRGIGDNVVYISVHDVDQSVVNDLKRGVVLKFKLYTDTKGVGGCDALPTGQVLDMSQVATTPYSGPVVAEKKPKAKQKPSMKISEEELSPEEIEKRLEKAEERILAKIAEESREVISSTWHVGEVVTASRFHAWVKPFHPLNIPNVVQAKLQAMNDEFRAKHQEKERMGKPGTDNNHPFANGGITDNVIYLRTHDVSDKGLTLQPGLQVKFLIYTDSKGVGACEVVSA
jgi:hypothetical protein